MVAEVALNSFFGLRGGYSCQLIRWSRAADQLPTIISVYTLHPAYKLSFSADNLDDAGAMHPSRRPAFRIMLILAVIYAPAMFLVGPILVVLGSIVFFFMPVALLGIWKALRCVTSRFQCQQPIKQPAEEPLRGEEIKEIEENRAKEAKKELDSKIMLVPFIIYTQFVGEAMTRFLLRESWAASLYNTWAARTAKEYFCHFLNSDVATKGLVFVGLM